MPDIPWWFLFLIYVVNTTAVLGISGISHTQFKKWLIRNSYPIELQKKWSWPKEILASTVFTFTIGTIMLFIIHGW